MKKILFTLAAIAWACSATPARAQSYQIRLSSVPTVGVDISSASPTRVINADEGWNGVCVQNLDTTNALYASSNILVSSITTNVAIGTVIPPAASATSPAQPTCFALALNLPFYVRTGSVSGTTRAAITKSR